MIRLDKYLANLGLVSRREASEACKSGAILVNGEVIKKSDFRLFGNEILTVYDQEIEVLEKVYAILYKSAGYISSDEDEFEDCFADGEDCDTFVSVSLIEFIPLV